MAPFSGAERQSIMLQVYEWVRFFLAHQDTNDAKSYGVKVEHVSNALYRVIGVHHLTPVENAGLSHVWLMVLDASGKPLRGIPVAWDWIGRHPDQAAVPIALPNPDPEPMGNIPMGKDQVVSCWVQGAGPSDRVSGLHTTHPDEAPGNTLYHHSFLVVWQEGEQAAAPSVQPVDLAGLLFELDNAAHAINNARALIVAGAPGEAY